MQNNIRNKFWAVVEIIAAIVLIVCIVIFGASYIKSCKSTEDIDKYKNTTSSTAKSTLVQNPIDFTSLQKSNKDIYSWITIKNTNIDYPILQPSNGNNEFYLRKDIYGNYDNNGCIYTENYNSKDYSDPVTVIYGHNIWTQQKMFYELHKFEDSGFFNKNKYIKIYTKNTALTYKIYSAFAYDDRHLMKSFDFYDKTVYQQFIDYTLNPTSLLKNVRKSVNVTTDDKIVILSTCIKSDSNKRYLVIGVLTDEQPTE